MSNTDGGQAFPVAYGNGRIEGMSLRDYFAAKAMQAMIAAEHAGKFAGDLWASDAYEVANAAYEMANAMLKARQA